MQNNSQWNKWFYYGARKARVLCVKNAYLVICFFFNNLNHYSGVCGQMLKPPSSKGQGVLEQVLVQLLEPVTCQ